MRDTIEDIDMIVQYPATIEELIFNGLKRSIPSIVKGQEGNQLNLGCGRFRLPDDDPDCFNLEKPDWKAPILPFPNESVGIIHAYHFLEHLTGDEVAYTLEECSRVLKRGAPMNICVPYARADLAFQDIDHKTFFTEESWATLMENPYYDPFQHDMRLSIGANFIAGVVGRNLAIFTQLIKEA